MFMNERGLRKLRWLFPGGLTGLQDSATEITVYPTYGDEAVLYETVTHLGTITSTAGHELGAPSMQPSPIVGVTSRFHSSYERGLTMNLSVPCDIALAALN
jgi:hypothetical protein